MNAVFEARKLQRELDRSGKVYDFYRLPKNEFGEPAAKTESEKIGSLLGLYHEVNDYIRTRTEELTQIRETTRGLKKVPKILCLFQSAAECNLKIGDYTMINGKMYKVLGLANIQELNIIADISLEVVEDGNHIQL